MEDGLEAKSHWRDMRGGGGGVQDLAGKKEKRQGEAKGKRRRKEGEGEADQSTDRPARREYGLRDGDGEWRMDEGGPLPVACCLLPVA